MNDAFNLADNVGAWVPHGRFVIPGSPDGPIAGLSFAVKDVFDVAGHPTGAGNPRWLATHPVPRASSPLVDQLLAAGATLQGKVLTDELAYSIHGDNLHYGTPRNTRAPDRVPGGSSSGSAAAVAAGLVDFALGTDTGGSTRVPASYCGLWGLRTTHGLLSRAGLVPLHPSFDTPTWLAADGAVFARVADTLLPSAPPPTWSRAMRWTAAWQEADAAFGPVLDAAWKVLAGLPGMTLRELPAEAHAPLDGWRQSYLLAGAHQGWQVHGAWITKVDRGFAPAVAARWRFASEVTAASANAAWLAIGEVRAWVRGVIGTDGVALLPSAASVAPPRDAAAEIVDALRMRTMRITCIAGLAGLPQVSLPCRGADGLPLGISLIGPAGSDAALIELARRVHAALPADVALQP